MSFSVFTASPLRIAVTGASGFIGRFLVAYLQRHGAHVVAISRSCAHGPCRNCEYRQCLDYRHIDTLEQIFQSCYAVVHLAARAHHVSSRHGTREMTRFREANLESLIAVSRAAEAAGVSRIVFISSIGVNGSFTCGAPFTEADIPSPVEPYSLTKLEAEHALASELASSSTDWVVLRPPLVYGPGCPGNLQRLIRLASIMPMLPFGMLRARRTFISIDNLVAAISVAVRATAVSRRVFVVSDAEDIEVASLLRAVLLGLRKGRWRLFPFPPSLISAAFRLLGKGALWSKFSCELRVDPSAFCHATGWKPVGHPRDGFRRAAEAYLAEAR